MTVATKTIPKGYKQTEIGVIPTDWDVQPISHIAKITTGSKNTQDKVDTGLYPFFVRSQVIERINSYSYDGEAVLTAGDGVGTGKVFHYVNGKFDIHQRVYKISDFSSDISGYYFYLYFSNYFYNRIMQMTAKSSVDSVRMEMIADMQIPLPGKPEQISIATALSDIDTLINKIESLIDKKKKIKQGMMQKLLQPYKKNGEIKDGWKLLSLFEIADSKKELFDDGDWIESEHISDKGVRLIQTGNIGIGKYLEKDLKKYIYADSFTKLNCKRLFEGDLLICRLADPAGRSCVLPNINEEKVITSVDVTIFRPRSEIANRYFLASLFSTDEWFKKVSENVGGTTHKRISKGALGKTIIALPKIEEQNESARILLDVNNEIDVLESELTKWRDMKQGMMQTLLTGKIRLIK